MDEKTSTIVRDLRALMPMRPLNLSDAYMLAELQASRVIVTLGVRRFQAVDLGWITRLPRVRVIARPRHEMPTLAGFTQWQDGRYLVAVNRNNNEGRRRFTLAHEFKHIIDHAGRKLHYAKLGGGDPKVRDKQIERIADHFAACLLMPRRLIKQAWVSGVQDIEALAHTFRVSLESMTIRLTYLGFLDDPSRPVELLFRAESRLFSRRPTNYEAA